MNRPPPVILPPSAPQSPFRLSAVGEAWCLFARAPFVWTAHAVPAMLILMLANWQGLIASQAIVKAGEINSEQASNLWYALALNLAGLWMVFFTGAGIAPAIRKQLAGQPIGIEDIFAYSGREFPALLVSAAMALFISVGYLCCYIPGILAEGFSMTANFRSVDLRAGFFESFEGSHRNVRSQLFMAGASVHVLLSILLVGGCIPFVGYLIAVPLYNIARGLFYVRLIETETQGRS